MEHPCARSWVTGILLLVVLFFPFDAGAFGVSPPFVTSDRLTRGSTFDTTIFLVQGKPETDLAISAVFDVPDAIRSWFSIDKGETFTIPAGIQQFPIVVTTKVPKDAAFNIYKGYLRINTVPTRKEGEQVNISVGARVEINLTVGNNVIADFTIKALDILDIREGEHPQALVTLQNIGNVPIGPGRATFELYDKYGEVRLAYAQTEKLPEVDAFQIQDFIVEFPVDIKLSIGEYWGLVRIYRDGAVVKELKTVFNVTERKVDYRTYGIGGGTVVLLGIISVFILRRRSRKSAA